MNFKCEVKQRGQCKHCGKTFDLWKPFDKHLAYDHGIYTSKIYKFKDLIRKKLIKNFR